MGEENKQQWILAVERFERGENPESICKSFGKPRAWVYKWVGGHLKDDNSGSGSWSRRPLAAPRNTPVEVEEIVKMISFKLYNQDLFCGVHAAPKHRLKKPETGNGAEWP
ncbi:hypothetical protein [uncultured Desulfosarcina sp.]|uniref:hypothetical protein n=1 Tax=uncultured Desulfosarcina sp. TaxID=218289 RepID=UPI0029C726B7|nr:hypothetical protein [uncultured Desulfosarcina sp.]